VARKLENTGAGGRADLSPLHTTSVAAGNATSSAATYIKLDSAASKTDSSNETIDYSISSAASKRESTGPPPPTKDPGDVAIDASGGGKPNVVNGDKRAAAGDGDSSAPHTLLLSPERTKKGWESEDAISKERRPVCDASIAAAASGLASSDSLSSSSVSVSDASGEANRVDQPAINGSNADATNSSVGGVSEKLL